MTLTQHVDSDICIHPLSPLLTLPLEAWASLDLIVIGSYFCARHGAEVALGAVHSLLDFAGGSTLLSLKNED